MPFVTVASPRNGTATNIVSGASSTPSSAFGTNTTLIRIAASAAVNYRVGDGTPTAVTTDTLLPANVIEYVTVNRGQRIAFIGTATVNLTECG